MDYTGSPNEDQSARQLLIGFSELGPPAWLGEASLPRSFPRSAYSHLAAAKKDARGIV